MTDHSEQPKPSLVERLRSKWHQDACELDPEGAEPFEDIEPEFHAAAAEIIRRQLRELAAYLREMPEGLADQILLALWSEDKRDAYPARAILALADHLEKETDL